MTVRLVRPNASHQERFLGASRRSTPLHQPWVYPPVTPAGFRQYLSRCGQSNFEGHLVFQGDELAGVINLSEVVMGAFCSCYAGYYAFSPFAGKGVMRAALQLTVARAFGELGLHRVEANIQPTNAPSLALVRAVGFRKEGYSPRFLRVGTDWKDHERWAITSEEFPPIAPASLPQT